MANRVLRDWTASDSIDKLSAEAEVFFTRLIMKADDFGRFHANPKLLIAGLFPLKYYTMDQVRAWRDECVSVGLLNLYQDEGKEFLEIRNFGQRLRNMSSKYPAPPSADMPPSVVSESPSTDGNPRRVAARNGNGNGNGSRTAIAIVDCFESKQEAHKEITANYQDMEAAKTILRNRGWSAVVDIDVGAVLFHFLEGAADALTKPRQEVRQHFLNWINKKDLNDLTKLSVTIQANARRRQESG